jgi:hypothetical protein
LIAQTYKDNTAGKKYFAAPRRGAGGRHVFSRDAAGVLNGACAIALNVK